MRLRPEKILQEKKKKNELDYTPLETIYLNWSTKKKKLLKRQCNSGMRPMHKWALIVDKVPK